MDNEFEADLITLIDDEGHEHEFEIIDELENDLGHFMALVPTQQDPNDLTDAETYYIFEVIEEDGEEQLQEVDDDELLNTLAEIFETRFNEEYFEDGEEE